MPPADRDPAATRAALTRWLSRALPDARGLQIAELSAPGATGYSHETLLFDALWDGGSGSFVARIEPTEHTVFLDPDFAAEARVLTTLAGTDVPVPAVIGDERDPSLLGAPFLVMERAEGLIPPDNPPYTFEGWLLDAAADEQRSVWLSGLEAMATVHRADPAPFGFLRRSAYGAPGLDEQLGYWRAMLDWAAAERPAPAPIARALEHLERARPDQAPLALCWGDARLANQVFDDGRCVAVLDWEMAALADPEMDLAWFCYFDRLFSDGLSMPPLPGVPDRKESVAWWEELTGRSALHQDFYEIFAAFRFAVILMRLGTLMTSFGQLPPDSDFGTNNFAIDFLARVLDENR